MKITFLGIACMTLLTLAACKPEPAEPVAATPAAADAATAPIDVISSGAALPSQGASTFDQRAFAGTFTGTLPCTSCPGIDTTLVLDPDGSYRITELYQNQKDGTLEMDGSWTTEADDQQIRLDPNSKTEDDRLYAITSNDQLGLLDLEGQVIQSGMNSTLERQAGN